jgi:hypothetical protein
MKTLKERIERMTKAGHTDSEVAARLELTLDGLMAEKGKLMGEDENWGMKLIALKDTLPAMAKEKLLDSMELELEDPNAKPENARFILERRSGDYNQKLDITSKGEAVSGFTITPPETK